MNRRSWLLRRWRRSLGWPGLAGAGLLVLALLFYAGASLPERLRAHGLEQEVAAARARASAPARPAETGTEARLASFYSGFPGRDTAPVWLEKLYAAGQQAGLALERTEYKATPDRASRLLQYEITLPVRGSYLQVRQFIRTALNDIPTMALREIHFRRANIGEPVVDAQIRFVLYLREGA